MCILFGGKWKHHFSNQSRTYQFSMAEITRAYLLRFLLYFLSSFTCICSKDNNVAATAKIFRYQHFSSLFVFLYTSFRLHSISFSIFSIVMYLKNIFHPKMLLKESWKFSLSFIRKLTISMYRYNKEEWKKIRPRIEERKF